MLQCLLAALVQLDVLKSPVHIEAEIILRALGFCKSINFQDGCILRRCELKIISTCLPLLDLQMVVVTISCYSDAHCSCVLH
jgi:hypothetical protein